MLIMAKPTAEDKKKQKKSRNCLPFGAFLIICFYSIWQQTGRFWKKSGDTATLVTNHSHFSSGKPRFPFVVLKLEWPGIQASKDGLELVDHSSYLCRLHNPGFSNQVYGLCLINHQRQSFQTPLSLIYFFSTKILLFYYSLFVSSLLLQFLILSSPGL